MPFELEIPKVDLDKILSSFPPTFAHKIYKFQYLLFLTVDRMSYENSTSRAEDFAPISSLQIQKIIGNDYRKHLDYLITHEILETDNHYELGSKAKGFRVSSKYLDEYETVSIDKLSLVQKLKLIYEVKKSSINDFQYLQAFFLTKKLTISQEEAVEYCKLKSKSTEKKFSRSAIVNGVFKHPKQKDLKTIWLSQIPNIFQLSRSRSWFVIDKTSGRLHTRITNLKSDLRQFLRYDNQPLCEIDIKNSQPYFTIKILIDEFNIEVNKYLHDKTQSLLVFNENKDAKELIKYVKLNESSINEHNRAILKSKDTKVKESTRQLDLNKASDSMTIEEIIEILRMEKEDVVNNYNQKEYQEEENHTYVDYTIMFTKTPETIENKEFFTTELACYIKLVLDGKLYDFLKPHLEKELKVDLSSRSDLKGIIFEVIYGSNKRNSKAKKVFRRFFPSVLSLFEKIKNDKKNQLPIQLQKIEAEAILKNICGRISKERPEAPIFTIHDSILTTKENLAFVHKIMIEELIRIVKVPPTLSNKDLIVS